MNRNTSRRTYLRREGAAAAIAGLVATPAAAADCDATVYTNASEGGTPKLEVPAGEATVTGESTCAPGTGLDVTAKSSGGNSPFFTNRQPTVQDGGRFAATFDFSVHDPGTEFQVIVTGPDGDELARLETCEVVSEAPTPKPTPTPTPTAAPTDTPPATADPPTPKSPADTPTPSGATVTPSPIPRDGPEEDPETSATPVSGPGFGVVVAVAGLAAVDWRLGDDN